MGGALSIRTLAALDDVLVLAWNFAEAIMCNHHRFLEQADRAFIVPLPEVTVFEV